MLAQVRQQHPGFRLTPPLEGLIPSTPPPYVCPRLGFFIDDDECPFDAWDVTAVPENMRMALGKSFSDLGDPLAIFRERCRRVLKERRVAAAAEAEQNAGDGAGREGEEGVVQEEDAASGAS